MIGVVNIAVVLDAAGSKASFTTLIYVKSLLATHYAPKIFSEAKILALLILFSVLDPDTPWQISFLSKMPNIWFTNISAYTVYMQCMFITPRMCQLHTF